MARWNEHERMLIILKLRRGCGLLVPDILQGNEEMLLSRDFLALQMVKEAGPPALG